MDGDGDMDYASPDYNSSQVSLWLNSGSGVFASGTVIGNTGVVYTLVPCDHDGDGDLDMYGNRSGANGGLLLFRNDGSSWNVELLASAPWCHGVTIADLNNDGRTDIITSSFASDDRMRVFLRQPDGSFAAPSVYGPFFDEAYQASVADLDGDGYQDVVLAGGGVRLLRGSPTGAMTDAGSLGASRTQCAIGADLNADGILELVIARVDSNRVEVWSRTGTGPLSIGNYIKTQDPACGDGPIWVTAADLDGDGDLDVVVPSHLSDTVHILRNDGGALLQDHVLIGQDGAYCNAVVDLNGDVKPDIITSNHFAYAFSVHFNQSIFDCNGNSIDDPLDIASGFSTDCNSNGRPDTCDLAFGLSQDSDGDGLINECEPTLISLTPNTLPSVLGGTVTVRGANIPDGTVRLDLEGVPVNFTMTGNLGTAVIPPLSAPRSSDLTVSGTIGFLNTQGQPDVTGATPAVFTWDVPEIVAATPGSAPFDQATGVVFTLDDHVATSGIGTATFGNAAPQPATLYSANGMTKVVTIAPAQAQPGPVSVLLRFGGETTLEDRGFVYLGPGITSMSQTSGWQVGGEYVSLGLYDFLPGVPVGVRFGNGETSDIPQGLLGGSVVWVTTPYTTLSGAVDIEVAQVLGPGNVRRVLSPGAWLANPPRVDAATPNAAYQGGGEAVSLTVAGFPPSAPVVVRVTHAASGGVVNVPATVIGQLGAASVAFTMPLVPFSGAVEVDVVLNQGTPSELVARLAGGFTVVGAAIPNQAPTSGPLEAGTTVVVQTSGFQDGVPAQVAIGGTTLAGVVSGSGASQTVTFRTTLATASGPSDVSITQGVFHAVLPAAYSFDAPRVIGYCTAKLTGQGTLPVIGFSGSPSVSTGDFAITLSNALPNKTAQYFYGGSASNFPLFGGFLCVGGSVTRGPLTSTNPGSFASTPFAVLPAFVGSKRYFQWWFRDPLDPAGSGRGLSAGLEVEFYN